MSPQTVPRKDVVGTLSTALGWLSEYPILVLVFVLAGIVDALGELNVVLAIIGSVAMLFADGLASLAAERLATGTRPDLGTMVGRVLKRLLSLIAIYIIVVLVTAVGLILLVVPGVYVWLRLSLAVPICVIEDEGMVESLSKSWEIAQGSLLKLFGITLVSFVVTLVTIVPVALGGTAMPSPEAAGLVVGTAGVLLGAVIGPVVQMAFARVYLENRSTGSTGSTEPSTVDDRFGPA